MPPVLEAIHFDIAAGAVRSPGYGLDLVQPVTRNVAEKRQGEVYVALRYRAAAAFAPRLLRGGVQPLLHAGRRPRGEEQPRSFRDGWLVARGSLLVAC